MIVSELIEKLQAMPQDMRVLQHGYESGFEDIHEVEVENVDLIPNNPWYEGTYQYPVSYARDKQDNMDVVTIS